MKSHGLIYDPALILQSSGEVPRIRASLRLRIGGGSQKLHRVYFETKFGPPRKLNLVFQLSAGQPRAMQYHLSCLRHERSEQLRVTMIPKGTVVTFPFEYPTAEGDLEQIEVPVTIWRLEAAVVMTDGLPPSVNRLNRAEHVG